MCLAVVAVLYSQCYFWRYIKGNLSLNSTALTVLCVAVDDVVNRSKKADLPVNVSSE